MLYWPPVTDCSEVDVEAVAPAVDYQEVDVEDVAPVTDCSEVDVEAEKRESSRLLKN